MNDSGQFTKKQKEQRNLILEKLYIEGPLSRADLSKKLKITPATISDITNTLIRKGLISELGEEIEDKPGRRKILLHLEANYSYYVGVELTENRIIICLTDNLGIHLETEVIELESDNGRILISEKEVIEFITQFIQKHSKYDIEAIGIAVPGHYSAEKQFIISNHTFWSKFQLDIIIKSFKIPIYIKNNVKCMALSQLYLNHDEHYSNFLFFNLKKGMFAAYVYDNKIYGDSNLLVGEIGHTVVNPNGERCECGKKGCLQTYASINWMLKKARIAFKHSQNSYLHTLVSTDKELKMKHLLLAYHLGDELVKQIIDRAISYLAHQINNSLLLLDLDAVYIHGKLFDDEVIAKQLTKKLEDNPVLIQQAHPTTIQIKKYNQNRGAIGACALAIKESLILKK